jgi:molecular chaperone HscB
MSAAAATASQPSAEFDPAADYFTIFGLPVRFDVDRDDVETRYLALAQAVHPDRFVGADSGTRRQAMERATALNEGYKVLRDPVMRAEYLVKLGGIDLDSSDPKTGAPAMNQAFLMDMIERREQVAEARAAGPAALDELRDGVEDEIDELMESVEAQLRSGETATAARTLVVRRYLQRLIDEIDDDVET